MGGAGGSGFSSLPTSIHHGLSEKLIELSEKLQQNLNQMGVGLGRGAGNGLEASGSSLRKRTRSLGIYGHPTLAVAPRESAASKQYGKVMIGRSQSSPTSPRSAGSSRSSSKKSSSSSTLSASGNGVYGQSKIPVCASFSLFSESSSSFK